MGVSVQQLLIILAIIVVSALIDYTQQLSTERIIRSLQKNPELAKGVGKGIKTFKKEMEDDTPEKVEKKAEEEVRDAEISDNKKA